MPAILFVVTAFLYLAAGFIFFPATTDVVLHDTYFVVSQKHIIVLYFMMFLFFAIIYLAFLKFTRPLGNLLGIAHYILTACTVTVIPVLPQFYFQSMTRRFYTSDEITSVGLANNLNVLITICAFGFALAQLLLLINIVLSLIRKKKA